MLIHEATVTNPPWGFGIQLQSEFKALLLNLEHNTQQPWVSVLHPEQGVTAEHCRTPPKNTSHQHHARWLTKLITWQYQVGEVYQTDWDESKKQCYQCCMMADWDRDRRPLFPLNKKLWHTSLPVRHSRFPQQFPHFLVISCPPERGSIANASYNLSRMLRQLYIHTSYQGFSPEIPDSQILFPSSAARKSVEYQQYDCC